MTFHELAEYFEKIEKTSSRIEITELLAELFSKLSPQEIEETAYLLQGRVCPPYIKADFGLAEKSVVKAIQTAFQIDQKQYIEVYKKYGDVGSAVEELRQSQPSMQQKDLSIHQVFSELKKITETAGEGSQEAKQGIIRALIDELTPLSIRYVVRIPIGAIRLGFSDMTILDAMSWMITGNKSLRKKIEGAYHVRPDLGYICRLVKEKGVDAVTEVQPVLFTPILMMRAERSSSGEEIVEKIGTSAIEPKYDGFRLQVHYDRKKKEVWLFTRGLEMVAETYPDIVQATMKELDVDSIIFEGEALGFNPETEAFLPFQITTQRKRKYDIEEMVRKIPLRMFTFEILYLNGKNYIHEPYTERRAQIEKVVGKHHDLQHRIIHAAPSVVLEDPKEIEANFDTAVTDGLEGIMAKKLDGVYQAGARGSNWIKFKRSYATSAIDDTIDCVVMGYDYGKGKRAGFGIGAFLAGVYDPKSDMFKTVAKIGTGLSDEEWKELKKRCDDIEVADMPKQYDCDKQVTPDVWVTPKIVVEIRADEITRSPVHTAGRSLKSSKSGAAQVVDEPGYALRFPRLERFRDDKSVEEATTVEEVATLASRGVQKEEKD